MADNQFRTRDDILWLEENRWSIWTTGHDLLATHEKRIPFLGGYVDEGAGLFTRNPLPDLESKCVICGEPTTGEKCGICIVNRRKPCTPRTDR